MIKEVMLKTYQSVLLICNRLYEIICLDKRVDFSRMEDKTDEWQKDILSMKLVYLIRA